MRAGIITCAALTLALGAVMSEQATAPADEPKKEEKKFVATDKDTYDEKVTVRKWDGSKFLNPVKDILAHRGEISGKPVYWTMPRAGNSETPKGSEIVAADGTVWVVEITKPSGQFTINYVKKKEPDKK